MPSCSVIGCLQRNVSDGITLHRFPHDPVQRQRWVDALRRENFVPGKSAVVCSRHFAEEDIDRTSLVCVRIRANAVPTVFPDCPSRSRKRGKRGKSGRLSSDVTSEQSKDADHGESAVLSASSAEIPSSSTQSLTSPSTTSTSSPSTTSTSSPSTTSTSSPSTTSTSSPSTTAKTCSTSTPLMIFHTMLSTSSTSTESITFPITPSTSMSLSASTSKPSARFLTMPLTSSNYTASSSTSTSLLTSSTSMGSTSALPNPKASSGAAQPTRTSLNLHLELKLGRSQQQLESSRKQIKILLQNKRRLSRRNARLKSMITDLKKQNSMRSESLQLFEKSQTGVADLLKRHTAKQLNEVLPCSYSAELRRFAQTLHYCSPRAYRYVRKMFNTCLPHPRTIERWHSGTDGSLGLSAGTLQDLQDHFEESQFEGIARSPTGGKKLKPNAVPTLFNVPNPPSPIAQHTHSTLQYKPDTAESDLKVGDHGYARRQPRAEFEEDELLRAEEDRPCSLCQHYKYQLEQQQQHTARLQREVEEMKKRLHRLSRMEKGLQVFLYEDQIRALTLSKRSRRAVWSHDTVLTAQKIRCAVGVKGYEFLRELGYPLPSYRTLCNRLEPKIMMSESMQEDLAELGLGIITACDSADENTASEEALIGMMT